MTSAAAGKACSCSPLRYPVHLVASGRLPDGMSITIRPIHPEDDAIERSFISDLSSQTRYNRLLSGRKMTPDEMQHLTRIDYEREMAFIAVAYSGGQTRLLGDARYVIDADGSSAEFALVVADAWQRKGVGSLLLGTLLRHAQSAGIARLYGITLATNAAVQGLTRKLGFVRRPYLRDATLRQVEKILGTGASAAAAYSTAEHHAVAAANDEGIAPGT